MALLGFFDDVTEYPTKLQKAALAKEISRLPGCEDYTYEKVQAYFKGKRKTAHRAARVRDEHAFFQHTKSAAAAESEFGVPEQR